VRAAIPGLEREAQRLARTQYGLAAAVGAANALSMWRTSELDSAGRIALEPAWFVIAVCSALALAIALHARQRQQAIEALLRSLREGELYCDEP
jgi:hypothetical protein